ncbi:hypothetical protein M422DRAFT_42272 [Sphaerobolus stellatus SS14]|nr:hypothetical protein M422DRAFT_42272 [Sphaerobolus stellatus SS14]
MENEKQSELRKRPLPPLNASGSPEEASSAMSVSVVPADTFYGDAPSTTQRNGPGSSFTQYRYIPSYDPATESTSTDPPPYGAAAEPSDWRAPELVQEIRDDDMPTLVPAWERGRSPTSHGISGWPDPREEGWIPHDSNVALTGRDLGEEAVWWDIDRRAKELRPGPGILPTLLADKLHDPDHSLFKVLVKTPEIATPQSSAASSPYAKSPSSPPPAGSPSSSSQAPPTSPPSLPPISSAEVNESVPNAYAYYCRKENGWILLRTHQSHTLPTLAPEFLAKHPDIVFPRPQLRSARNCAFKDEYGFSSNLTHHYHHYPKAISSALLNYRRAPWEIDSSTEEEDGDRMEGIEEADSKDAILLDLFVCCQCHVYVVCSDIIPGIIPAHYLEEFVRNKMASPLPGQTGADAALVGLDTMIKVIENLLWKNETRAIPLTPGKTFHRHVGISEAAIAILSAVGFKHFPASETQKDPSLAPQPLTKLLRKRYLRAWMELSTWTQDFAKRHPPRIKQSKYYTFPENARESYQMEIGAHPDQNTELLIVPRTPLPGYTTGEFFYPPYSIERLGFTPTAYTPELLEFAYRAQCRCNPESTAKYFDALFDLIGILREASIPYPQSLDILQVNETERGRWRPEDVRTAARMLGFGRDHDLKVELDEAEDEFVYQAWEHAIMPTWKEPDGHIRRKDLTRALHVIAESRGSRILKEKAFEGDSSAEMTPEKAYGTLEVPPEVDEEMLITVFNMRVEDSPANSKRMKDALTVIARTRDSTRLLQFCQTGEDPGKAIQALHPEWPRGLNQLGNTCYLNSLLQYFYTIKELRDALIPMDVFDAKLSDDDLKKHRVGGRLVTLSNSLVYLAASLVVSGLISLFWELEHSGEPAVTPELELAKLALVTSKDEEEDEHGRVEASTDSSADTDATLVDEPVLIGPMPASSNSPTPSSGSILGKRQRRSQSEPTMDVDRDDLESDGFLLVHGAGSTSPRNEDDKRVEASDLTLNQLKDVEMRDIAEENKPPPLPPRRKPEVNSDSVMMFGKQHDVAECMDNCMFQIETALLRFDEGVTSDKDKTSIVKRLFYGSIRQRITPIQTDVAGARGSSVHEKEDVFSHLPVNVSEESFDIYDGLSGYFDDTVEFDGRKMKMEVSLVDVPPVLQIQLQRVQFNRDTLQPYKSHAYVRFGETLYVDRFLDSADPAKRAESKNVQAELNARRDRIHALTRDKGESLADVLDRTHDFLANQDVIGLSSSDDDLLSHLQSEKAAVETELTELRAKASELKEKLEEIWKDEKKVEYELTSVFVHRGSSPSWGHYFFYSRCLPDNPDVWFKYNDSEVTQVGKEEVLADTTGSTANPYLLVYARKGADMVQTVNRTDLNATL